MKSPVFRILKVVLTAISLLAITLPALISPAYAQSRRERRTFLPFVGGGGGSASQTSCNPGFSFIASADEGFEQRVLTLINQERAKVGAPALSASSSLTQLARYHSRDMASKGIFSHTGSAGDTFGERISWGCDRYSFAGEIIAAGYGNPEGVIQGWLSSPPHKGIMLDPVYRMAGVGYAVSQTSEAFWTVDFITPVTP